MPETELQTPTSTSSQTKKKAKKVSPLKLILLVLLFGVGVLGYLFFTAKQEVKRLSTLQGQQELAKKEVADVTEKLGKLTILPQEEPVVATILDSQLLATQSAFYQDSENGDKLVVYPKAQKAYIYSPTKNIIVNAGPLIVNQDQSTRPVRFEVRNGTGTAGAAAQFKEKLEAEQMLVSAMADANKKDYQETLLVLVNENIKPEQIQEFADTLKTRVVTDLPEGEAPSEADILIIVGSDAVNSGNTRPSASPAAAN